MGWEEKCMGRRTAAVEAGAWVRVEGEAWEAEATGGRSRVVRDRDRKEIARRRGAGEVITRCGGVAAGGEKRRTQGRRGRAAAWTPPPFVTVGGLLPSLLSTCRADGAAGGSGEQNCTEIADVFPRAARH